MKCCLILFKGFFEKINAFFILNKKKVEKVEPFSDKSQCIGLLITKDN